MAEKQEKPELKKRAIHKVVTFLAPKRTKTTPEGKEKQLSRGVTKEALDIISKDLNTRLKSIVRACEEALIEINQNPNATFIQKRYDAKVIERAMQILRKRQLGGST